MKYILITALTVSSIIACNDYPRKVHTERMEDNNTKMKIEDDSKILSIKVQTRNTENPIDYNESFDVRDMSEKQKQKLENHILDSLELKNLNN